VSNDLDGVPDDGREPVDAAATGEAAGSSPAADASTGQQSAADGHDKPRTAPPGSVGSGDDAVSATDGVADGGEAVGSDVVAAPAGGTRRSGGVAAGSARAAARRSAAQAAGVNMPGGTAGTTDRRKSDGKGAPTPSRAATTAAPRPNMFARFGLFLREVVAELRKVIWPNRNQMVTYTIVVIIFVSFMVAFVAGLDVLFAKGVLAIFG
jgi:preprotein translocase subunit SecE